MLKLQKIFSISSLILTNLALVLLTTGCACSDGKPTTSQGGREVADAGQVGKHLIKAEALLKPLKDNHISGKVTFVQVDDGIKIIADVNGLSPGKHGFHIYEHGVCSGEDVAAAGAHFNPTHNQHGGPDSAVRHLGDLGNLIADHNGHAYYHRVFNTLSFDGPNTIIGRSIIIHADPDDYKTQPAGASGAKISCGLIEAVAIQ